MVAHSETHPDARAGSSGSVLAVTIVSWAIVAWMCYVFLGSLPYKFTNHPDTQHIFSTIGAWLGGFLGTAMGNLFANFGGYVVGSFELLTSLVLLSPIGVALARGGAEPVSGGSGTHSTRRRTYRAKAHALGGLMASCVMAGAVFFHLASPLGVEVLHEGQSDGGSLFYAAVSILVLGVVLWLINRPGVVRNP